MSMILSSLSTAVRRLAPPTLAVVQHQVPKMIAARFASTTIRHLAGHAGPTTTSSSSSSSSSATNPSEEARQAAEHLRKLQENQSALNEIHNEQPMFAKAAGPDSLPGDRDYKRQKASKKT